MAFPHDSCSHLEGGNDKAGEREKVTELWTIKTADRKKVALSYNKLYIYRYIYYIHSFMASCVGFSFYGSSCHKMFFHIGSSIVFVFICVSFAGSDFPRSL